MHEVWGIPFDWPWPWFVLALIGVAILYAVSRRNPRLRPTAQLALAWVVYEGIVWEVWGPLRWFFWIFFWLALVAAIIYAITAALGPFARFLARVVLFLLVVIVIVSVIFQLDDDEVNYGGTSGNSVSDHLPGDADDSVGPTSTPTTEPTTQDSETSESSDEPTGEPSGTSTTEPPIQDCPQPTWHMSTSETVGDDWFSTPMIEQADTPREAFQAFKRGWYKHALNYAVKLDRLSNVVLGEDYTMAELSNHGFATCEAYKLGLRLSDALSDATYSPEHEFILVELPNGTSFRVTADTGQLQQLS